jgi:glycosyltransferase involved in cell wall biosynthesis
MKNKILIFSGIYPLTKKSTIGIFIRKRLENIKNKNIIFDVFSIRKRETIFVKLIKIILRKKTYNYVDYYNFGDYKWNFLQEKISITGRIIDKILGINRMDKLLKIILNNININNYDIISVHWGYPEGYLAKRLKDKYGIPYILTLHGSDIHTNPNNNSVVKKYTLEALENADKCIFVSNFLKNKALELGYSGSNAEVIYNGYDSEIFKYEDKFSAKKRINITSKKLIGYVGDLIDIKNVLFLVNIFKKIKENYSDVSFVIIGDGYLKLELQKKMKKQNLKILFTGEISQNDVSNYMKAMDILILPSKNEGFPCVILEAKACGTYCVGSNRGGIPEAIGEDGKTFELDNNFVENISSHILSILMSGYNIENILRHSKNYAWEMVTKKELDIFSQFYKNKGVKNSYE